MNSNLNKLCSICHCPILTNRLEILSDITICLDCSKMLNYIETNSLDSTVAIPITNLYQIDEIIHFSNINELIKSHYSK